MTRKDVLNKLRDMGIAPIAQSVLSDFTEIAKWAAEVERTRMVVDGWRQCAAGQKTTQHCGLLERAVEAERERCAKVCEDIERKKWETIQDGGKLEGVSAMACAVAIRGMK